MRKIIIAYCLGLVVVLSSCGKADKTTETKALVSGKEYNSILDEVQSLVEPEKIKTKAEYDEARPTASKEIENSRFEDFKIQILDMIFVLDGSMTLRDVAKTLENSRYELQYELSEGGVVSGDEEYDVRFNDIPLFTIQASQISEDEKFVDAYDAVLTGIKIKNFASVTTYSESVFLPGGIGIHNGKSIKEICGILEAQGISDMDTESDDGTVRGSLYSYFPDQNKIGIALYGKKASSFGYYPMSKYTLDINNGDGQVEKIELEHFWISEEDPYQAPEIKAYGVNAKRVRSLEEINKEGLDKCMLETADIILNGSYEGKDLRNAYVETLTPYGMVTTEEDSIFVYTDSNDLFYFLWVELYSNGRNYYAKLVPQYVGARISVTERLATSVEKGIKDIVDEIRIESSKTVKKGDNTIADTNDADVVTEKAELKDGIYETLPGWVKEMNIEDNMFTITAKSIWSQEDGRNDAFSNTVSIPISDNIGFGNIDVTSEFVDNSNFNYIKKYCEECYIEGAEEAGGLFFTVEDGKVTRVYLVFS